LRGSAICRSATDDAGLSRPAISAPTPHRRAISLSDHAAHSGSDNSVITARRLSLLVRRIPCEALAPTLCSTASRCVPWRTSAAISASPSDAVA
jgi:hypothetical protein